MDHNWVGIFAMVCAGIAIVATVVNGVMKYQELKALREIRDRMDRPR